MVMTTEEAIWTLRYVNPEDPTFSEAIDLAVKALRAQASANGNPPLTLEELREMDGEPVWLEVLGGYGHYVMSFGFEHDGTCVGFYNEISRPTDQYGKTWTAYRYRRKPEEGQVHGILF